MTIRQNFLNWWGSDENTANRLPESTRVQVVDFISAAFTAGAKSVKATDFGINELKRAISAKQNAQALDNIPPLNGD